MVPEELKDRLKARVAASVTSREAAVDVLKELQRHYGWLTDGAVSEAAEILGLSPLQVDELATFYEMLYRRPVGQRVIHVCDSISCWSVGCAAILEHLRLRLGVEEGGPLPTGCSPFFPAPAWATAGRGRP
jgi:NADH-quinone oxidoreductase subunit E